MSGWWDEFIIRPLQDGLRDSVRLPIPSAGRGLLANPFLSERDRELAETQRAWEAVDDAWRASPLAGLDTGQFALHAMRETVARVDRVPAVPILMACGDAIEALLEAEDVDDAEPDWEVIGGDLAAGVEFRAMMRRRQRWAADFERMRAIFTRQVGGAFEGLFESLSDACFSDWESQAGAFGVPLIELVDEPAQLLDRVLVLAYDDDTLRYDIFLRLRRVFARNLLVASGFPPTADPSEHQDRLIIPTRQKNKSPSELVELYLAGTPFRAIFDLAVPFHIPQEARFEHCHVIGGTGHGKTQLLQHMIHADLIAAQSERRSVIVIDSQGDLINKLMRLRLFAPDAAGSLADRLVIIDPSDVEFPASLNLFDAHLARTAEYRPVDRERVLNGVVELYETFFGALLGAELTQKQGVIFKYLARLMLTIPNATIHTLMRLMEDGRPFKPYMERLEGSARHFFETEFFDVSFAATKKQILKRLWGVLSTPAFERMFAQHDNKLDLFAAMNEGKIVLINTAKDLLKTEGSQLFGRFFISMISQAALERSTLPPEQRTPTFVYVDEAQEYFDDTTETILNQARKYRVGLTLAHQTLDQLTPRLRSTLLANTSVKFAGGVSAKDARALCSELRTTSDFIEGMRRRRGHTEFAAWLKQSMPQAVRLSVPLGFVERQPSMDEDELDALFAQNRARYCGTIADSPAFANAPEVSKVGIPPAPMPAGPLTEASRMVVPVPQAPGATRPTAQAEPVEPGKGGPKHKYLQHLVKELAEQQGLRATIEAPLAGGGQADVLIERDGTLAVIEISVSTSAQWERDNLQRCLRAGVPRVALVLAKSKRTEASYRAAILEGLNAEERGRLTILTAAGLPDYLATLAPPPDPAETIVRGYKVRVAHASVSPESAKLRRETLARLVARSVGNKKV